MRNIKLSEIRRVLERAGELEREGKDIIHLEIGEPDFDTPANIVNAAVRALYDGQTHYETIAGNGRLRAAIAKKLREENGVDYLPEEILVTNGVAEGIFLSMMAFLDPGDEILLPDPGYLTYFTVPEIFGIKVCTYPLTEETGFQVSYEDLMSRVTPATKMILLISPNNPTGTVLNRESLLAIAKAAVEGDLLVLADEIYEKLLYTGKKYISIASLPGMKERTILLNGFSKYYAMTGWRIGYMAVDRRMTDVLIRAHFYNLSCLPTFTQIAAAEALEGSQEEEALMVEQYRKRRDLFTEELKKVPGIRIIEPEGAFYVFANVEETGMDGDSLSRYLLEEAGVATVPGSVFGKNAENYIRLSFAVPEDHLRRAAGRIKKALESRTG